MLTLKIHVGDDKKYVSLADAIRTACRRLLDQLDDIDLRHGRIKVKNDLDKVDQESEEYLKWKQGSVPVEEPQEPIEPEQIAEELPEPKRSKIFFMDWFFGVETHMGQMKMMYYSFTFFFIISFVSTWLTPLNASIKQSLTF